MVNYNESKIYKIEPVCDHDAGDIYIGSTTKTYLSDRMCDHRADYKRNKERKRGPNSSVLFDKYGVENCKIHLIMLYPCNTKDELLAKEGEYIRTLNCVHKVIPGRKKKEYDKDYRIKMKDNEEYQQKRKDYRQNVFEKTEKRINYKKEYSEKYREIITCECGCSITLGCKTRHEKNKKHLDLMKIKNAQQDTEE